MSETLNDTVDTVIQDDKQGQPTPSADASTPPVEGNNRQSQIEEGVKPEEKAELRKRHQTVLREQQRLEKLKGEYSQKEKSFENFSKAQALIEQGNIVEAGKLLGLTAEKIQAAIKKSGPVNFEDVTSEKLTELEKEVKALREEKRQAEQEKRMMEVQTQIKTVINSDKARFEILNTIAEEGIDLVLQEIEDHYQKTQKILDWPDAAERVEKRIYEQALEPVLQLMKTTKMQSAIRAHPELKALFNAVEKKIDTKVVPIEEKRKSQGTLKSSSSHASNVERMDKPLTIEEHNRLAIDLWNKLQRKKGG